MHRKWEKLGICCRDNLGEFAVGRIFGRAGAGGGMVRRAAGPAPVCLRLLRGWRGGVQKLPPFPGAIWQGYAVIPA